MHGAQSGSVTLSNVAAAFGLSVGSIYEIDSKFEPASNCYERALHLLAALDEPQLSARTILHQNLGCCKLQVGQTREGIRIIESVLDSIEIPSSLSDSYIDLCYGYLDLEQYARVLELYDR